MYLKKILTLFFIPSFFFLTAGCSNKKESLAFEENKPTTESIQNVAKKVSNIEKKCDLYTYSLYDLPLFSIIKIAKLSDFMKTSVDEILKESQGFYFLTNTEKGVLIILQNPIKMNDTYSRHDLQFVEILFNGEVLYHTAGYSGADGENLSDYKTDVDKWFYDNSSGVKKPIKHISYDENNKIKFIETWNYEETEPIKYEMVDSMKKTMSVL